jgi:hypothetical protein
MMRRSLLAWLWTLVIFVLCWLPRQYIPGQEKLPRPLYVVNFDKIVHAGIFAVFGFLWMKALDSKRRAWWIAGWGVVLAIVTELGQENRIVNRDCNLPDGLADSAGVLIGLGLFWYLERVQARRLALKTRSSETP